MRRLDKMDGSGHNFEEGEFIDLPIRTSAELHEINRKLEDKTFAEKFVCVFLIIK